MDFKEKEIEYHNNLELFSSHFITAEELRKNKSKYELAKMQFEISKNTFEIYKSKYNIDEKSVFKIIPIKAPIGGIVTEDNVEEGNYVKSALSEYNEGTVICVIGNFDKLKADFAIAEEYLSVLRKTEKVSLKTKKGENLGIGRIVKISPLGNSNNGYISFDFSVQFKSPQKHIYPGASVQAEIIIAEKESCLKVPISVIGFDGEQAFVNLKNSESSIRKDVTIGIVGNRFVEIISGLKEDDLLVY
jgi:multidrug efflux pump subunit AcrA (membrane-fusion protein)